MPHAARAVVSSIALLVAALGSPPASAQGADVRLDPSLREPAILQAVRECIDCDAVQVRVPLSSMVAPSDDADTVARDDSIDLELTRDNAKVLRLVDDLVVLLRSQCPVIPSWTAIAQRAAIGRAVACRAL